MVEINAHIDYYAVLGVSPNVMPNAIKFAYRELARMYHPDAAGGDAAKFRLIQEAYDVLSDQVYRRTYDKLRESRGYSAPAQSPVSFEVLQNVNQLPILDSEQIFYVIVDMRPNESYVPTRQRLNLALVIDCSNSMRGARMHNVKMAASDLLNALREDDYLSIVSFHNRAKVEAISNQVGNKRAFLSAIAAMSTGGGTEIYQGLLSGLFEVNRHTSQDTINHVLLLTDGITYGDEEKAINAAQKSYKEGIGISAFGIGEDWNDLFLDKLAQAGGGISQFIESPNDIKTFLRERIQNLSNLAARRVRMRLNTAPYITIQNVYRIQPHMESLLISKDNVVFLGDIALSEPMVLVIEIIIKSSKDEMGDRRVLRMDIQAERNGTDHFAISRDVHITFTEHPEEKPVNSRILNTMSRLSVYRLQEKAWNALEDNEVKTATRYLESAATKLFDLGYPELAKTTKQEAERIESGQNASKIGRKRIRYGTRLLSRSDT